MDAFKAYRIVENSGAIEGAVVDVTLDELPPGDVLIKAAFSSVNYKDALAGTGRGKVVRRFPIIGGIDVAGRVVSSADGRFHENDEVLVTGHDLGVSQDGGYAEYVRVPAQWVVPLPQGLSLFEAMVLGTAGFTAALSLIRLEQNGLTPTGGPVIVTGATGGVGSVAVGSLSALGYQVTALTGKDTEHDYLRHLGANDVLSRSTLQMGTRPLERATWAGAIDPVGGDVLAWLTRTMLYGGSIASSGLAGGTELRTTVLPFILRGINLLGIDSVACPMPLRLEVWRRLATDMKPRQLDSIGRSITLAELTDAFHALLNGAGKGRTVVAFR